MNSTASQCLRLVLDNKVITILSLCLFAFVISTIVLSSQKSTLQDELDTCNANHQPQPTTQPGQSTNTPNTESSPEPTSENSGAAVPSFKPKTEPSALSAPSGLFRLKFIGH
ncbi:uncharacterized protein LOC116339220 [Contarinia nasturtii]|uniref:uncharacterized protein LOC116339220 n=1 Tax=Contarinia nasturtii TaxID=265458 RepID=UPI0012D488BA|nr:uncharacterized protein LOC116339220 [Contarinia nasturtii]